MMKESLVGLNYGLLSADENEADDGDDEKPGHLEYSYGNSNGDTVFLVIMLVLGVGLIFICFATVAICYR